MKMYIRSAAAISPQQTFNTPSFLNELVAYNTNRLTCIEPDYSHVIDPRAVRRMSRVIKMSVVCALACLKEAGVTNPDAIITGTAYGCLEDTGTFLTSMVEQDEEPITPTAFVQSTHNTIGAQIALLIKCAGYNNTFVSGGASFENALQDASMLMAENNSANVLVGGMDEITDMSHAVLSRLGLYRRNPVINVDLFNAGRKGTINGEGSSFFLMAGNASLNDVACIEAVDTFYQPESAIEVEKNINSLFERQGIDLSDIDLIVTGNNGDEKNDSVYKALQRSVFKNVPSINYKQLCGEYPTSTGFAVWLSAQLIKTGTVPESLRPVEALKGEIKRILIYNHYQHRYHSLILLASC